MSADTDDTKAFRTALDGWRRFRIALRAGKLTYIFPDVRVFEAYATFFRKNKMMTSNKVGFAGITVGVCGFMALASFSQNAPGDGILFAIGAIACAGFIPRFIREVKAEALIVEMGRDFLTWHAIVERGWVRYDTLPLMPGEALPTRKCPTCESEIHMNEEACPICAALKDMHERFVARAVNQATSKT